MTTGRKRRCGWFDAPVVRYAHALNGFTSLNLTKLDVLDDLEVIRIGASYKLRGELLPPGTMPSALEDLADVEVVYEGECARVATWQADSTHVLLLLCCSAVRVIGNSHDTRPPPPPTTPSDLPGWKTSTQGVTNLKDLPKQARAYIKRIEELVGVPVAWIGTGPKRDHMVMKGFKMPTA